MSIYKLAIDRIRHHKGYLSQETFDAKFIMSEKPESMAAFIKLNGCLVTTRHDLNPRFGGRDFLINVMTEIVVLHISSKGDYTLHRWEKSTSCSEENRLPREKENFLLSQFLEREAA